LRFIGFVLSFAEKVQIKLNYLKINFGVLNLSIRYRYQYSDRTMCFETCWTNIGSFSSLI